MAIEGRMHSTPKGGFTLLEISMVLIIIGLLAGSILLGQELILLAQVRRQVTQIEQMNTAVNTFRGKFDCIPGDCPNAVELGLGVAGDPGDDGNGDGILNIDSSPLTPSVMIQDEIYSFWYHLGQANLIEQYPYVTAFPVLGVNSPPLKLPGMGYNGMAGGLWVEPRHEVEYTSTPGAPVVTVSPAWKLTANLGWNQAGGLYSGPIAFMLDSKIDDSLPESGIMISALGRIFEGCRNNACTTKVQHTRSTFRDFNSCIDDRNPNQPPQYSFDTRTEEVAGVQNGLCLPLIRAQF